MRIPLLLLLLSGVAGPLTAQNPVRYEISFPERAHHEAEIRIQYDQLPPGTVELRMSRTSPGRYALHEFAKNVYNFRAVDGEGRELPVERPDPHQWNVSGHGGRLTVTYTLFGDRADGTYVAIDPTHAHLNIPATFMWARGLLARPVEVRIAVPQGSGWRVATQLQPTDRPDVFRARDHHYFLDSPIEVSDFSLREWEIGGQTLRIAMHHTGTEGELDRYLEHTRAIVAEEIAVYGELPEFDHGSYTFLACYLPWADGDGMEHRNSTILTSSSDLAGNMIGLLGTVAHEFFHAWNIERIRPASLEPFDFEAANMSRALWFGEGFTSYYDDLAMVRGGVIDPTTFGRRLGASIDAVVNSPGRGFFSPIEMSMQAPFVDAAVSVDPVNRGNTFISYYTWGSVVALGLDLSLRERASGVDLDLVMREMWRRHGRTERPYSIADIEEAVADVAGSPEFAGEFFDRFIRGRETPDFQRLLAEAGFLLRPAAPGRAILARVPLVPDARGLRVGAGTLVGSPLHTAGVERGDVITSIDGVPVTSAGSLDAFLRERTPGDEVVLNVLTRGAEGRRTVVLAEDPSLVVVPVEEIGEDLSPRERSFRLDWLGTRAPR